MDEKTRNLMEKIYLNEEILFVVSHIFCKEIITFCDIFCNAHAKSIIKVSFNEPQ